MTARDALFVDPAGPGTDAPGTDAADARLALSGLLQTTGSAPLSIQRGILAGHADSLAVIPGSGMTVIVKPGSAVVPRNDNTGAYIMANDSNTTVTIPPANPNYPRIDLLYLRQEDVGQGDATTRASFGLVTGTPAPQPVIPQVMPGGALELAAIRVEANAQTIQAAGIGVPGGWRPWTVARGGVTPCADRTRLPQNPYVGQLCYLMDAGHVEAWSGQKWIVFTDGAGGWSTYAPQLIDGYGNQVSIGAGATWDCRYKWVGSTCQIQAVVYFGSSGVNGGLGSVSWTLPPGVSTFVGSIEQSLSAKIAVPGLGALLGEVHIVGSNTRGVMSFPQSLTNNGLVPLNNARTDAAGNVLAGSGAPTVPNGFPLSPGTKLWVWGTLVAAAPTIVDGHPSNA
jgi:hypothetical protein